MSLTGKFYADMAGIADWIREGADDCILDGKISEQQRLIRKLTDEIGNLTVLRLDKGEEMSPEIMERYEAIKEIRKTIDELNVNKKNEFTVCPECGAKTTAEMNYCGKCGSALKK